MSRGGARLGAGRPLGSTDRIKRGGTDRQVYREEREAARAAQDRLIAQIVGTKADPLYGLVRIPIDESESAQTRMIAMRTVLPYIHATMPIESHHAHVHAHAKVDEAQLIRSILDRIERIAATAAIEAEAVAQPVEPKPAAD